MIATGFVDAGAKVYISSRKADVCDALAAELSKSGDCTSLPADLSTEAECRRLAGELANARRSSRRIGEQRGRHVGAPMADYDEAAFGAYWRSTSRRSSYD